MIYDRKGSGGRINIASEEHRNKRRTISVGGGEIIPRWVKLRMVSKIIGVRGDGGRELYFLNDGWLFCLNCW